MGGRLARLAAAAAAVLVAACTTGSAASPTSAPMVTPVPTALVPTATPGDPLAALLRDAAAATIAAGPFSLDQVVTVSGSSAAPDGLAATVSGKVALGDRPQLSLAGRWADPSQGTFDTIATANLLLLRGGYLGQSVEPGRWLLLDVESRDQRAPGVAANAAGYLHTSLFLYYLYGATGAVRDLGRETLNGIVTSHYAGSVDLDDVVGGVPDAVRDRVRGQAAGLAGQNPDAAIGIDVWIDPQGLVRQLEARYALSQASGGGEMRIVGTLGQFGQRFDLQLPDDEDIVALETIPMEQPPEQ